MLARGEPCRGTAGAGLFCYLCASPSRSLLPVGKLYLVLEERAHKRRILYNEIKYIYPV